MADGSQDRSQHLNSLIESFASDRLLICAVRLAIQHAGDLETK